MAIIFDKKEKFLNPKVGMLVHNTSTGEVGTILPDNKGKPTFIRKEIEYYNVLVMNQLHACENRLIPRMKVITNWNLFDIVEYDGSITIKNKLL